MASDHFCLKWNNFHNSILTAFESLQSSEDLVDVTLMCEGRNVKAHKVILSACSPYFRNLFKDIPCQHPVIILKDVLHCDLVAILQFMYQGEVLITQDGLTSFLKTAELLQVSGLAGNNPTNPTFNSTSSETPIVPTQLPQPPIPAVIPSIPIPISSPSSPRPSTNKHYSEKASKPNEKEIVSKKEVSESKTEPLQSCSYETNDSIMIKTETEDPEFEDMDYSMIEHENIDDPGPISEEPSILERSLKAQGLSPHSTKLYTMDLSIGPQISTIPTPHPELMKNPCVAPLVLIQKQNNTDRDAAKRKIKLASESIPSTKKMFIRDASPKVEIKKAKIEASSEPSPPRVDVCHGAQFGKCPHCSKVYSNQSALKYHVRLVHSDMLNMFCCHLCPESFEYRETYKAHMWDKHSVRN